MEKFYQILSKGRISAGKCDIIGKISKKEK
jgi:hypothetical protein